MTKKPQPLLRWDIYRAAAKARLLGTVEAKDAEGAIAVAVKEFQIKDPKRLIAVRRAWRRPYISTKFVFAALVCFEPFSLAPAALAKSSIEIACRGQFGLSSDWRSGLISHRLPELLTL
jgi:hypothetical protein